MDEAVDVSRLTSVGASSAEFGRAARARALRARLGADLDVDQPLGRLSVADEQQVQIAAAVGTGARVLVFDEPTSSLSEGEARRLFTLIEELVADGLTVLYVSHRLPEVERLCDRVTVLRDGRVVADGRLDELLGIGDGVVVDVDGGEAAARAVAEVLVARGADVEREASRLVVGAGTALGADADAEALFDVDRDAVVDGLAGIRRLGEGAMTLEQEFLEVGS